MFRVRARVETFTSVPLAKIMNNDVKIKTQKSVGKFPKIVILPSTRLKFSLDDLNDLNEVRWW